MAAPHPPAPYRPPLSDQVGSWGWDLATPAACALLCQVEKLLVAGLKRMQPVLCAELLLAWRGLIRHSLYSLWQHYIRLHHNDPCFLTRRPVKCARY